MFPLLVDIIVVETWTPRLEECLFRFREGIFFLIRIYGWSAKKVSRRGGPVFRPSKVHSVWKMNSLEFVVAGSQRSSTVDPIDNTHFAVLFYLHAFVCACGSSDYSDAIITRFDSRFTSTAWLEGENKSSVGTHGDEAYTNVAPPHPSQCGSKVIVRFKQTVLNWYGLFNLNLTISETEFWFVLEAPISLISHTLP